MTREYQEIADSLEERLKYRLNRIPKEFKTLKIKDIIQLERSKQINFATLILDIRNLKENLLREKAKTIHSSSQFQPQNRTQKHPRHQAKQTRQKLPQLQTSLLPPQRSSTNNEGIRLRLRSAKDKRVAKTQWGNKK